MIDGMQIFITRRPLKNKLVKSVNCVKIIVSVTLKQFIQYQTDATRKAAEIIEKSKVRTVKRDKLAQHMTSYTLRGLTLMKMLSVKSYYLLNHSLINVDLNLCGHPFVT